MKKAIGFILLAATCAAQVWAGEITRTISYSAADLKFSKAGVYDYVEIKGARSADIVVRPALPVAMQVLSIPSGAKATSVEVVSFQKTLLTGVYNIFPSQPEVPLSIDPSLIVWNPPDTAIYNLNTEYPVQIAALTGNGNMCGYSLGEVALRPLHYIPATGKLVLYTNITYKITYVAGTAENVASELQKNTFGHMVKNMVVNPEAVDAQSPLINKTLSAKLPPGNYPYVIITKPPMDTVFQRLASWKTKKGVPGTVVSVDWIAGNYSGYDLSEKVRNFIKDARSTWSTMYVLLGGQGDDTHPSENIIPARHVFYLRTQEEPSWRNDQDSIPCDLYYAGISGTGNWDANNNHVWGELSDGADLYPDIFVGRAPVVNIAQAQNIVYKILKYEKCPPGDYIKKIILPTTSYLSTDYDETLSQEAIAAMVSQDWTITKLYYNQTPFTQEQMIQLFNEGYGLSHWVGHGLEDLIRIRYKLPAINLTNDDADTLQNGDRTGIANAISCFSGAMDPLWNDDCLADHLINKVGGGTVGAIMNSRFGWGAPTTGKMGSSELLDVEIFNKIFNTPDSCKIGVALAASKTRWAPYADNPDIQYAQMRWCLYELNLFGDPEMPVWVNSAPYYTMACPETVLVGDADLPMSVLWNNTKATMPAAGACVKVYLNGVVVGTDTTDAAGAGILHLTTASTNDVVEIAVWDDGLLVCSDMCKVVSPRLNTSLRDIQVIKGNGDQYSLAWAVGDNGRIKKITVLNSKQTITDINVGITGFDQTKYDFKGLSFPDSMNGWVVGYKNSEKDKYRGVILNTANGGGNWSVRYSSDAGVGGILGGTSDSLTPFLKVKMTFYNSQYRGYISCGKGYILRWNPVYKRWEPKRPSTNSADSLTIWYNGLWMKPGDPNYLWASGDERNLFVKTTNGGGSWTCDSTLAFS
ncbi:hypothetical protein HY768_05505 [candidate division TA06 bacterium]|uniref:Gingipain domain-containing protein n=1 Tax=candidate division TA06 bacterium TaxID=2250710 RepID=A0A933MKE6_UNCT6|nr:hypothetical protein [candidate division TA06 bacterium]